MVKVAGPGVRTGNTERSEAERVRGGRGKGGKASGANPEGEKGVFGSGFSGPAKNQAGLGV